MVREICLFDTYSLETPDGNRLPALVDRNRLVFVRVKGQPKLWYESSATLAAELNGLVEQ